MPTGQAKWRLSLFIAVRVAMAGLGAIGGHLIGRSLTLNLAQTILSDYATRIMQEGEFAAEESRRTLERINSGSGTTVCRECDGG